MPEAAVARRPAPRPIDRYDLWLYVAGPGPKSVAAFRNLELLCEEHLAGSYEIRVIDLLKHPELAQKDQIVAVPTLVRNLPSPTRKVVGNLSNTERVLASLDLQPRGADPFAPRKGGTHAG